MHLISHNNEQKNQRLPLFSLNDLYHSYPDGQASLSGITLDIFQGDRIALVGQNGSGKTSLVKHLNGLLTPREGQIFYLDKSLSVLNMATHCHEVGMLFQDPDDHLFCNSLYEDVAFGPLNMGHSEQLTDQLVKKSLSDVGLIELMYKPAQQLSYGQKKRAAFACIMAMNPSVLILDEPSANLDPYQEKIFKQLLENFKGTLICINHDLIFLYGLCNRAVVLSKGRIHHDFSFNDLVSHPSSLREHGLDFSFRFSCCSDGHHHHSSSKKTSSSVVLNSSCENSLLDLKDYTFKYDDGSLGLENVNLIISENESLALVGENGAGKSTLAKVILGIHSGTGKYFFDGKPVVKKNKHDLWRQAGMIFQDSADQLFCPTCWDEVAFGPQQLGCSAEEVESRVVQALKLVNLSGYEKRVPLNMSGGERKRLAIAAVLSMKPRVLILDEPTAGLDPQGEEMLLEILKDINLTLILISHDIYFIEHLSSRTLVIHQGQIIRDYSTPEFLSDQHLESVNNLVYTYKNTCSEKILALQDVRSR